MYLKIKFPAAEAIPMMTKPASRIPRSITRFLEPRRFPIPGTLICLDFATISRRARPLNLYIYSSGIILHKMAKSESGGIKGFVKDMALGAAAGATVDAFLEVSHAPAVNNPSPFNLVDPQE